MISGDLESALSGVEIGARQLCAEALLQGAYAVARPTHGARVLDLGCGVGDSVDWFRALDPQVRWIGLDTTDSPESAPRTRQDARFAEFDGGKIPFDDSAFDLVFSKQVLEHVRSPVGSLREVARVLRGGGAFFGSTSQLEPFHSRSTVAYTPLGLRLLFHDAGLRLLAVHPGVDSLTLIARSALGSPRFFDRWWIVESPANRAITAVGRAGRWDARKIGATKLLFAGQLAFIAVKPAP